MRSMRAEGRRAVAAIALALAASRGAAVEVLVLVPGPVAPASAASVAASPRAAAVEAAVATLRADPLISGKHRTHVLQWHHDDDPDDKPTPWNKAWLDWLLAFGRFLNDTSRLLVWGLAVVAVALLLVGARRFMHLHGFRRGMRNAATVSHVRDLDVRPESLPADVGAAAWSLWQAGDVAAALSLLYRGALSRLIHRHAVPIAASTTEGECLALAQPRLDAGALRYLTQVVRAREAAIYGGRTLSDAMGEALCGGFATRLDAVDGEAAP